MTLVIYSLLHKARPLKKPTEIPHDAAHCRPVTKQALELVIKIEYNIARCGNADPGANVSLPPEAHDKIAALSDVETLNQEYQLASESVQQKCGGLQNAPESDPQVQDCKRKMLKLRAKKEFYRSHKKSRLREGFFEQKNIMLIEAQLNKTDAKSPPPQAPVPWIPPMPERAELPSLVSSVDMRSPDMLGSRIAAIQAMTNLCGRVEPAKRSSIQRAARETRRPLPWRRGGPCGSR